MQTPSPSSVGSPASSRSSLSFRSTLIVGICGLVFLTGSLILWLNHRSCRNTTEVLTGSIFREVSGRTIAYTQGFVLRAAPVVESLVQLAARGLALDDSESLALQLLAVLNANPGLSWVSYGDERGSFTGVYRTPEGELRTNRSTILDGKTQLVEHRVLENGLLEVLRRDPDSGYDPRNRPFYMKAKEAKRLVWLPPYIFFNQQIPGISCAQPVFDSNDKIRGVFSVDFDLMALSNFVVNLNLSDNSRVAIFNEDQTLIASPARLTRSIKQASQEEMPNLSEVDDRIVQAFRNQIGSDRLQNPRAFQFFDFHDAGVDYLGSITRFKLGEDLTWLVAVMAPEADFVGDVWRTQGLAMLAAVCAVIGAILFAFLLARAVSKPVQSMIGFMNRVGEGDLEAKAEFGGTREFRQLADALNQMIGDLRDRLRIRHSLGVAMEVQRRLLPAGPPTVHGLDVAGHSTYCDETGGDYYDFVVMEPTDSESVLVTLGDVMGHGVAAALVMAGVRAVLRDRANQEGTLADLMSRLNRLISADHGGERFMTMHLSQIDSRKKTMRWVSAGHDPALIFNPKTNDFLEVGDGDLPLGIVDEMVYEEKTFGPLEPGQVIVVGTDGVWELPNEAGDPFGKDRLKDAIRESASQSAETISETIRKRLSEFKGGAKSVDDVTFVIIKVTD